MGNRSFKRALSGRVAHVAGAAFEKMFEHMCQRNGVAVSRVPDGCRTYRGAQGLKLARVKSPFDWIVTSKLGANPVTVLCDTKSTQGSTFPYSQINQDQLNELRKHAGNGIIAGYVIEFRETNQVFFYPVITLAAVLERQSLKPQGIFLGSSAAFDVKRIYTPTHYAADPHNPGRTV